jgi:hypothetical protein
MAVGASHLDIEHIAQPLYSNPQQKKVSFALLNFVVQLYFSAFNSFIVQSAISNKLNMEIFLIHTPLLYLVLRLDFLYTADQDL